jgi:hypothetical protein
MGVGEGVVGEKKKKDEALFKGNPALERARAWAVTK